MKQETKETYTTGQIFFWILLFIIISVIGNYYPLASSIIFIILFGLGITSISYTIYTEYKSGRQWKKTILKQVLFLGIIIIGSWAYFGLQYDLAPTRERVETFLRVENPCWDTYNPYESVYSDENNEIERDCAEYYWDDRAVTLKFGKIEDSYIHSPFNIFYYHDNNYSFVSVRNYISVLTRDYGALVYNPVNGESVGTYKDLMSKMGCETPDKLEKDLTWKGNFKCHDDIQAKSIDAQINLSKKLNCSSNVYDCWDFKTQGQAQRVLEACGLLKDPHMLDIDKNNLACDETYIKDLIDY